MYSLMWYIELILVHTVYNINFFAKNEHSENLNLLKVPVSRDFARSLVTLPL